MSWLLSELTRRYPDLGPALDTVGVLEEDHTTDWQGRAWSTPSIIDHDDGKEGNGRAAD